jgi:hypothetical protein
MMRRVATGDHLSNEVAHLNTRIHLNEIKSPSSANSNDACAAVANFLRGCDATLADTINQLAGMPGAGASSGTF